MNRLMKAINFIKKLFTVAFSITFVCYSNTITRMLNEVLESEKTSLLSVSKNIITKIILLCTVLIRQSTDFFFCICRLNWILKLITTKTNKERKSCP
jgi:hypothetical protein